MNTQDNIQQWEARLNREWPQRLQVAQHVAERVAALRLPQPQVLELACGAGFLGAVLLRAVPNLRYLGFDHAAPLLDYVRARLAALDVEQHGSAAISLYSFDLTTDAWIAWLHQHAVGGLDAVVSLQSIHDVGDAAAQATLHRRVRMVLRPGGLFAYADLLLDPARPHPRRLSAAQHIALLREAGFAQAQCTLQTGDFGCFVARA